MTKRLVWIFGGVAVVALAGFIVINADFTFTEGTLAPPSKKTCQTYKNHIKKQYLENDYKEYKSNKRIEEIFYSPKLQSCVFVIYSHLVSRDPYLPGAGTWKQLKLYDFSTGKILEFAEFHDFVNPTEHLPSWEGESKKFYSRVDTYRK